MSRLKSIGLEYIIIASEDMGVYGPYSIREEELELLDVWEKREMRLRCEVSYEITGDMDVLEDCWGGESGLGRKLCGRWTVGESVRIVMKSQLFILS
jgi:hypothetical protein